MHNKFAAILLSLLVFAVPAQAGLTSWSTSNYLRRLSAVYGTDALCLSVWMNRAVADLDFSRHSLVLGTSTSDNHRRGINTFNNALQASSQSTIGASATSITVPTSQWVHLGAEFITTSSRASLVNGADRATNTSAISPNASDSVYLGVKPDATGELKATVGLAEASVWNCVGLSEANMDSLLVKLAAGENPINVNAEGGQPWSSKLVAYWPLTNTTDLNDASGNGHHLTMVGTLTNHASHPTIDAVSGGATRRPIAPVIFP
jgi:hypothetical protein